MYMFYSVFDSVFTSRARDGTAGLRKQNEMNGDVGTYKLPCVSLLLEFTRGCVSQTNEITYILANFK